MANLRAGRDIQCAWRRPKPSSTIFGFARTDSLIDIKCSPYGRVDYCLSVRPYAAFHASYRQNPAWFRCGTKTGSRGLRPDHGKKLFRQAPGKPHNLLGTGGRKISAPAC